MRTGADNDPAALASAGFVYADSPVKPPVSIEYARHTLGRSPG